MKDVLSNTHVYVDGANAQRDNMVYDYGQLLHGRDHNAATLRKAAADITAMTERSQATHQQTDVLVVELHTDNHAVSSARDHGTSLE